MLDLTGKVAFVAGAGSVAEGWGNGRATSVLFARQGASVFGTDFSEGALAGTDQVMAAENLVRWQGYRADMTSSGEVKAAVDACVATFGRIDILVNNVGGSLPGNPVTLPEEDFDRQIRSNLNTAFLGMKHVIPVMQEQFRRHGRGGAIVNISSIASKSFQLGGRMHVGYAASKAGLETMGRASAMAFAEDGIRVNSVVVGMVDTPLVSSRLTGQLGSDEEALKLQRARLVPMGRMGTAWDVAHAALFLASDEANYITAAEIIVDGGVTASRLSPARA
ncbi:SDR family NAD(P)-dependent oxidoreductase [Sphingobium sp. EP60837]|uniref:SDR family NAD(P)-dependent oxidoreductase n=1 Tax=Sphingobium sp. EP60837 TaxID=1855519 RepID=UPI0007DD8B66|nr:SDR family oxidoreductase [Sphingobium sp. EP60837]ANI80127.1 3-oxoacyl-[acyl-carrier-protein] reductase [Sphingobium sp. EP60837]